MIETIIAASGDVALVPGCVLGLEMAVVDDAGTTQPLTGRRWYLTVWRVSDNAEVKSVVADPTTDQSGTYASLWLSGIETRAIYDAERGYALALEWGELLITGSRDPWERRGLRVLSGPESVTGTGSNFDTAPVARVVRTLGSTRLRYSARGAPGISAADFLHQVDPDIPATPEAFIAEMQRPANEAAARVDTLMETIDATLAAEAAARLLLDPSGGSALQRTIVGKGNRLGIVDTNNPGKTYQWALYQDLFRREGRRILWDSDFIATLPTPLYPIVIDALDSWPAQHLAQNTGAMRIDIQGLGVNLFYYFECRTGSLILDPGPNNSFSEFGMTAGQELELVAGDKAIIKRTSLTAFDIAFARSKQSAPTVTPTRKDLTTAGTYTLAVNDIWPLYHFNTSSSTVTINLAAAAFDVEYEFINSSASTSVLDAGTGGNFPGIGDLVSGQQLTLPGGWSIRVMRTTSNSFQVIAIGRASIPSPTGSRISISTTGAYAFVPANKWPIHHYVSASGTVSADVSLATLQEEYMFSCGAGAALTLDAGSTGSWLGRLGLGGSGQTIIIPAGGAVRFRRVTGQTFVLLSVVNPGSASGTGGSEDVTISAVTCKWRWVPDGAGAYDLIGTVSCASAADTVVNLPSLFVYSVLANGATNFAAGGVPFVSWHRAASSHGSGFVDGYSFNAVSGNSGTATPSALSIYNPSSGAQVANILIKGVLPS